MFILKYLFSDIPSDLICLSFVQARKCICLSDGFDYSKSKLDPSNCNYMCSDTTLLSTDCGGETSFNVFLTGDILIKENMLSIYAIESLNYERCEQRFVNYKCRKKHAVFDIVLTNTRNNTPFFIFTDTTIVKIYSRCLSIECGANPKFSDYSCKSSLSSICSNLCKNIDCFINFFFSMCNMW